MDAMLKFTVIVLLSNILKTLDRYDREIVLTTTNRRPTEKAQAAVCCARELLSVLSDGRTPKLSTEAVKELMELHEIYDT